MSMSIMAAQQNARAAFASPGAAMLAVNQRGMSKNNPRLRSVKRCIDQVVLQVFQGHAQVQLQGSTSKGTSLQDSSDWDFFVRLNSNIDTVTSRQRMAVHDQLRVQLDAAGISYRMQCGENRIRLFDGRDAAGVLPDCDVVFQRFKSDLRVPPNNKALASSHPAQQVVRYIKSAPGTYTNLSELKSSMMEQAVMKLDSHMRCQLGLNKQDMQGAVGYERLLNVSLQAVAGIGALQGVKGVQENLQKAGVNGEWRAVAKRVLNYKAAHGCWPQL